jgi:hypothetical protein
VPPLIRSSAQAASVCAHSPYCLRVKWVPCHHGIARPQVADVRWVPCHHGIARPQVADVKWVPCHHGIARPQVADGEDFQIWMLAANLTISSRGQPTRGRIPVSGLGIGL